MTRTPLPRRSTISYFSSTCESTSSAGIVGIRYLLGEVLYSSLLSLLVDLLFIFTVLGVYLRACCVGYPQVEQTVPGARVPGCSKKKKRRKKSSPVPTAWDTKCLSDDKASNLSAAHRRSGRQARCCSPTDHPGCIKPFERRTIN